MAPSDDIDTETTPLLRTDFKPATFEARVREIEIPSGQVKLKRIFETWEVTIICGLLAFFADLGSYIFSAPFLRETELMICREHYMKTNPPFIDGHGNVPERFCKTDSIAQELAILRGWLVTFENISGIIVAVPFGLLADRYGRRLVAFVALGGDLLALTWQLVILRNYHLFPSKVLMTTPAFLLIGGGSPVIVALLMALIADSLSAERRSKAFFYFMATVVAAELAGTPIATLLMTKASNWTALVVGYVIMCLCSPIIWLISEKPPENPHISAAVEHWPGRTNCDDDEGPIRSQDGVNSNRLNLPSRLWQKWDSVSAELRSSFHLLFHNRNIVFGMMAFLASRLNPQLIYIMPQYVSKRYDWTIAQANLLSTFRAVIELSVLGLLLPTLTSRLHAAPHNFSPPRTDTLVARFSVIFLAVGSLICGLAFSPLLMAFGLLCFTVGYGYRAALQSFMSASVQSRSLATLYVLISVADIVGNLLAAPLLASTLARGIRGGEKRAIGGPGGPGGEIPGAPPGDPGDEEGDPAKVVSKWIGLPYLVAAALFLVTGLCTMGLSVEKAEACLEGNKRDADEGESADVD